MSYKSRYIGRYQLVVLTSEVSLTAWKIYRSSNTNEGIVYSPFSSVPFHMLFNSSMCGLYDFILNSLRPGDVYIRQ